MAGKRGQKQQQEDMPQHAADSPTRALTALSEERKQQVWELHLRAWPKSRIAAEVGIDRSTVSRILAAHYREVGADRPAELREKLAAAIARMRLLQRQAWADHDADDERERAVLAFALRDESDGESDGERVVRGGQASVKYQSQRAQYLRVLLDAEKEIARLEGLYEGLADFEGTVIFRLERSVSDG